MPSKTNVVKTVDPRNDGPGPVTKTGQSQCSTYDGPPVIRAKGTPISRPTPRGGTKHVGHGGMEK